MGLVPAKIEAGGSRLVPAKIEAGGSKIGAGSSKTKNSGSKKMLVHQKLKAVVAKIGLVSKIKIVELHPFCVGAGTGKWQSCNRL